MNIPFVFPTVWSSFLILFPCHGILLACLFHYTSFSYLPYFLLVWSTSLIHMHQACVWPRVFSSHMSVLIHPVWHALQTHNWTAALISTILPAYQHGKYISKIEPGFSRVSFLTDIRWYFLLWEIKTPVILYKQSFANMFFKRFIKESLTLIIHQPWFLFFLFLSSLQLCLIVWVSVWVS